MSCSHKNEPHNRFCTTCGKKLSRIICQCGASNHCNHSFCGACGNSLREETEDNFASNAYVKKPNLQTFIHSESFILNAEEKAVGAATQTEIDKLFKK